MKLKVKFLIFLSIVMITTFALVLRSILKYDKKLKQEFFESEFNLEVDFVNYENKNYCIHFTNGDKLPFMIDLFDTRLSKMRAKKLDSVVFQGDSIFKLKNEKYLIIKPLDGRKSFLIW